MSEEHDGSASPLSFDERLTGNCLKEDSVYEANDKKSEQQHEVLPRPKRPLSAYNLFFQEERHRLLENLPSRFEAGSTKAKRSHGKINFKDLGKTIGARWKDLTPQEKSKYEKIAAESRSKYMKLSKKWKQQQRRLKVEAKRKAKRSIGLAPLAAGGPLPFSLNQPAAGAALFHAPVATPATGLEQDRGIQPYLLHSTGNAPDIPKDILNLPPHQHVGAYSSDTTNYDGTYATEKPSLGINLLPSVPFVQSMGFGQQQQQHQQHQQFQSQQVPVTTLNEMYASAGVPVDTTLKFRYNETSTSVDMHAHAATNTQSPLPSSSSGNDATDPVPIDTATASFSSEFGFGLPAREQQEQPLCLVYAAPRRQSMFATQPTQQAAGKPASAAAPDSGGCNDYDKYHRLANALGKEGVDLLIRLFGKPSSNNI